MTHESIRAHSCLSYFSRESRRNALARDTSPDFSTRAYVKSPTALALGIILGFVTFFVLFEDVLMNGAKITTDHVLTLAVLLIVSAAGHMWWTQLRSLHVFTGFGLVVVFLAGLLYLVIASGGRNAEVAANKRNAAHFANTERARIKPLLEEAEGMRSSTARKVKSDCVDGKASKKACDGLRTSLAVYEAAVKGHEAALEKLGPPLEENGAIKSTARVLIALYDVPDAERDATEKRYVERLELVIPYVKALLVELATVVFLGCGIGHRATVAHASSLATVARPAQPKTPQPSNPTTVAPPATVARLATITQLRPTATVAVNAEALALQLLQRSATVAQEEIVQLFGGNKSKASRWLGRLEREGRVTRTSGGRSKFVALR